MKTIPWIAWAVTLYLLWMTPQLIFVHDGGLWAAYSNVWADWAMHLTNLNHFVKVPLSEWFYAARKATGTRSLTNAHTLD